ncbi:MAG: hypothetical protein ACT4OX_03230 [Actinomycetota bacterium]
MSEEITFFTLHPFIERTFPSRVAPAQGDIRTLVDELKECGIATIAQLDGLLDRALRVAKLWEAESPPVTRCGEPPGFDRVGIVRTCLMLTNEQFAREHQPPDVERWRNFVTESSSDS